MDKSMKIGKGQTVELEIEALAFGGEGIARIDRFVVFVKGAVPGDIVRATIFKKRKAYAQARIEEIISPSRDRIEPPCPYSGYCGGCQLQHVKYDRQLFYKRNHVIEAFSHIADIKDVLVREAIPSQLKLGYRNKMEFSFSDRRWLLPGEMHREVSSEPFALGLHVPGTFNKVIDIDACLLQQETGNRILRKVKEYAKKSAEAAYGIKSHQGFWRFLMIRSSRAFDEWMINLVTSEEKPSLLMPLAESLIDSGPDIKTVVNNITDKKASVAVGEREVVLAGNGYIEDMIGVRTFQISANSFFQTNPLSACRLYEKVVEFAAPKGDEKVLDLYSGTGTIPIFLSDRVSSVTGIEISESAVMDARKNCVHNEIDNCNFICGDIRKVLSELKAPPDVMVIDPPRAGMHKDVLDKVIEMAPERIVYVSCNPATMARDVSSMNFRYQVEEIQPVDMFPHTYHIESVARLSIRR